MICYPDNIIYLILIKKLNGFSNIARYIIDIKNDKFFFDFNKNKEETIETHFYEWLNHDLKTRQTFNENRYSINKLDINLYNYYQHNLANLGLNHEYRRIKSLSNCFESKWWKTTAKNYGGWNIIHRIIKSNVVVLKALIYDCEIENPHDWVKVSNIKSKNIINNFYLNNIYRKNRFLLEDISFIYLNMESFPIIME
jgi:hypothetical protein